MFFCTTVVLTRIHVSLKLYVDRNGVVIDMDTGAGKQCGPSEPSKVGDDPTCENPGPSRCGAWATPQCPP